MPADVAALEEMLSRPTSGVIDCLREIGGDILILGAGGKMGPTLARMAQRGSEQAGVRRRVIAVSRFTDSAQRDSLGQVGVETVAGDLLDAAFLESLPGAPNVVFMAGMKFGATGNEALTWQMNTVLPALVGRRFADSRIAAFSTGNVYGLSPLSAGGSSEDDPPNPYGEYAMSCLGRERAFEHASRRYGTRVSILRLNYACELRYGVLVDLAQRILAGDPVDLSMPMVNVIWQGDANAWALQSLALASAPATILNLAGPEQLSVQRICSRLADRMQVGVAFSGEPGGEALLSSGQLVHRLFGYPGIAAQQMIDWTAQWVMGGGELLGKRTKFEVRDGRF